MFITSCLQFDFLRIMVHLAKPNGFINMDMRSMDFSSFCSLHMWVQQNLWDVVDQGIGSLNVQLSWCDAMKSTWTLGLMNIFEHVAKNSGITLHRLWNAGPVPMFNITIWPMVNAGNNIFVKEIKIFITHKKQHFPSLNKLNVHVPSGVSAPPTPPPKKEKEEKAAFSSESAQYAKHWQLTLVFSDGRCQSMRWVSAYIDVQLMHWCSLAQELLQWSLSPCSYWTPVNPVLIFL